jgi:hypothetical protein
MTRRWVDWSPAFRETVLLAEALQLTRQCYSATKVFVLAATDAPDTEIETEMLARAFICTERATASTERLRMAKATLRAADRSGNERARR